LQENSSTFGSGGGKTLHSVQILYSLDAFNYFLTKKAQKLEKYLKQKRNLID
jgi:hypothetical protein